MGIVSRVRKQAGIPPVPGDMAPSHRQFFQALRENLAVRMGQEGDPMEQAVTFQDLANGGVLNLTGRTSGGGSGGGGGTGLESGYDYSPPPALAGLEANGGFDLVFLTWDDPGFTYDYFVEIWRSPADALDLNSPDMKLVGRSNSALYVDYLNGDQTQYYYWVRAVKSIGNQLVLGAFNATAGTPGQITLDPALVIEALEGKLTASELAPELLTPISAIPDMQQDIQTIGQTAGEAYSAVQTKAEASVVTDLEGEVTGIKARYSIKLDVNGRMSGLIFGDDGTESSLVIASNSVYFIDPNSSITAFNPTTNYTSMDVLRDTQLVFGYATVEGQNRFVVNVPAYIPEGYITTLMAKNITVTQGQIVNLSVGTADIEEAAITTGKIASVLQSTNFVPGSSGWQIHKSGAMELNNLNARGTLRGSRVEGSTIEGSAIIGSAFLAYSEAGNPYAALTSTLVWTTSGNFLGWAYTPYCDIFSANYSNTSQYRRFRRFRPPGQITVTSEATNAGYFADFRIQVYRGSTLIADTGIIDYLNPSASGSYFTATWTGNSSESCTTDCSGTSCTTVRKGAKVVFNFSNFYFSGNSQLRYRIYCSESASYSGSFTAYNDY